MERRGVEDTGKGREILLVSTLSDGLGMPYRECRIGVRVRAVANLWASDVHRAGSFTSGWGNDVCCSITSACCY